MRVYEYAVKAISMWYFTHYPSVWTCYTNENRENGGKMAGVRGRPDPSMLHGSELT